MDLHEFSINTSDFKALSITWVVLALPATFAEVVGVALKRPGVDGYLHVQLFAGFMYIIAGILGESAEHIPRRYVTKYCPVADGIPAGTVWILRAWKVSELERKGDEPIAVALETDMHEQGRNLAGPTNRPWKSYMRGLWVLRKA